MILHEGIWWPDSVGEAWRHALRHVTSLEWALNACSQHRVAIQAGGNIGLWPKRMADRFRTVYTFEPEPISRECLQRNTPANVIVSGAALGAEKWECAIKRKGLGSHKIQPGGTGIPMIRIDALDLPDVDLIQLDVEGYEWGVLVGAQRTLERWHPVVQVELREAMLNQYGKTAADVRELLARYGYREASHQPGSDVVFL